MDYFRELEGRPTLRSVNVGGVEVEKGSRVLLWPGSGGDIMDIALKGKVAFVECIEQDYEDRIYIAVTLEDDPGRDLGGVGILGHRFFFSPEEVEPLDLEDFREP
jgi:hydrogenase maturation protease